MTGFPYNNASLSFYWETNRVTVVIQVWDLYIILYQYLLLENRYENRCKLISYAVYNFNTLDA